MQIKEAIKRVAESAAAWPAKYQPGAQRMVNELLKVAQDRPYRDERFMTTTQYAEVIGATPDRVRSLCELGKIKGAFRTSENGWWMIDTWLEEGRDENEN